MKRLFFIFLISGILIGAVSASLYPNLQSYEKRRENIINDIESLIEEKTESGEYKCCIEPSCNMCFLGEWLWDDGICRCDDLITNGENDKVCPECKAGIKEGRCKSEKASGTCPINIE